MRPCAICGSTPGRPHSLGCLTVGNHALEAMRAQHMRRIESGMMMNAAHPAIALNHLYYDVPAYKGPRP